MRTLPHARYSIHFTAVVSDAQVFIGVYYFHTYYSYYYATY